MNGEWVRRRKPPEHVCDTPPVGKYNELWRCECGRLWRIGWACDYCDTYGPENHQRGQCVVGTSWRLATFWQRVLYSRASSTPTGDVR